MLAERRPVAPSLLSDPAFSTNPYSHPYAVTGHEPWLSSPPTGHPTLKSKSRRRRPADDTASDSEPFHIIPPPNSPVNFADGPPRLVVPNNVLGMAAISRPTLSQSTSPLATAISNSEQSHPALSPSPPPTARPPATPKRRITLMTILKRRSSQQPQSSVPANPKPRKTSKSLSNKNGVTQLNPIEAVPPATSTPPTAPTPSTAPQRRVTDVPTNRLENLDRIDELDETNPWGIGFHHGGPYEAAAQAIRGKEKMFVPGHGSYNRGVPQSNDNKYSPPQAMGFPLNLSPGQILPRNFQAHYTPSSQHVQNTPLPPTAVMMKPPASAQRPYPQPQPRMVPPMQSSATLPVSSRRQSYQTFSTAPRENQPRRQSFNPTPTMSQVNSHTPSPLSSEITLPQSQQPHRFPPPVTNPQPPPTSITHHSLPNRVTEDPLSSVNLVSIGIGMAMLEDSSDEDEASPPTSLDAGKHSQPQGFLHANTGILRKMPPESTQSEGASTSFSLATQSGKVTLEEMLSLPPESPPPYSSPTKEVQPREFGYLQAGVPSQPSSTSSMGSSVSNSQVAPRHTGPQTAFKVLPTQVASRVPSVQDQPGFGSDVPRSYPPSRSSSERAGFEDTSSVHPSVSSKSSSSRSSGPPLSRRFPKHLVMPAPLAQSQATSPQYQHRPPLAQLPPQRPSRQSLPHPPYAMSSPDSIPSTQVFVKAQAQEIHFPPSKAGKLKKRGSLMGPASQLADPPVVTTVSFTPPIIGYNNGVARDDDFGPAMTEKLVHKRVLSKRKSNW